MVLIKRIAVLDSGSEGIADILSVTHVEATILLQIRSIPQGILLLPEVVPHHLVSVIEALAIECLIVPRGKHRDVESLDVGDVPADLTGSLEGIVLILRGAGVPDTVVGIDRKSSRSRGMAVILSGNKWPRVHE